MTNYKAFSAVIFCLAFLVFLCTLVMLGIISFLVKRRAKELGSDSQVDGGEEEQLHSIQSGNPLDENGLISGCTL